MQLILQIGFTAISFGEKYFMPASNQQESFEEIIHRQESV
jgi:hypothetical protein